MWFIYVKRSGGRAAYRTHPSGRCRLDLQKKIINSIIVQWRGESKAYIQLFCVCKLWYRLLIVKYYISHILLQVLLSFAISEWRTKKLYHKVSKVTFKNRIIRVVYWKYFDFFSPTLLCTWNHTTHSNFLYWFFFRETTLLRN